MSASPHSFPATQRGPDVLGELLHSISQPLTSLRCSLELTIEEVAERQQRSVAVALQQTEQVIGMIQLMREYVDAEQPGSEFYPAALAPAMRSVVEALSSIAAVRGVGLRLVGTCAATVPVPESRLRLALQYLIASMIEGQPVGGKILLLLGEGPAGAVLRVEGAAASPKREPSGVTFILRRVRLAIATRVLESAGASLVFGDAGAGQVGFVLRIPSVLALLPDWLRPKFSPAR